MHGGEIAFWVNCDDELGIHNYCAEEIMELGKEVGISINVSTKGDNIIGVGLDTNDDCAEIIMMFKDKDYKPIGMHLVDLNEEKYDFDDDFFTKYGNIKFELVDATDINECFAAMQSEEEEKK